MRLPSPSSFGYFRVRYAVFDLVWAAATPLIALHLRDAYILSSPDGLNTALLYCGSSFAFCLIAFSAFRINDGISRYFSVHDALNIAKAVLAAQLLTGIVLFSFTRLEGIPRSVPLVHLLVLATGLYAVRVVALLMSPDRELAAAPSHHALEHAIIIGSTNLSSLYIKFLRAYSSGRRRVVAVLDSNPKLVGRAIAGVPIIAPPQNLEAVIDEFAVHGIRTDRIIIGGDRHLLPDAVLSEIRWVCERRELDLVFVTQLVGLHDLPAVQTPGVQAHPVPQLVRSRRPALTLQPYFQYKRLIDFFGALAIIILLSPIFLFTALLVLLDVGSPVLFWQQRIGQGACSFLMYKFRTLRSPFDAEGNPIADDQRISLLGTLLRKARLDELPQLFNVLVGDMSLIGPRPLLPEDQPSNSDLRLAVRPGITGWAQINGGNLITVEEKGALDEWYVRNASIWLDLSIVALTIRFMFTGEKRSEGAVAEAKAAVRHASFGEPVTQTVRKYGRARRKATATVALQSPSGLEPQALPVNRSAPR